MVEQTPFGQLQGRDLPYLTLSNDRLSADLIPFGATLRALRVPDRSGGVTDVCLGYDDLESYRTLDACLGGTIGRCANRIGGARFTLDGREYRLTANEGENQLHGGRVGFHQKLWQFRCGEHSVTFLLDSPDGEEGFPGNLHAEVTYRLEDTALVIDYQAVCDQPTVVNLTNHAYFNLAGHDGGPVSDHVLTLNADSYTPAGEGNIPTGVLAPVAGAALDLRSGAPLGERLDDPMLQGSRGFDHNYVLRQNGGPAASLLCPRTGISMEVETSLEGMQVYTAGFLSQRRGKGGAVYGPRHAVCLETQHFPDAVNQAAFPSPVLRPGQVYRHKTVYRFSLL